MILKILIPLPNDRVYTNLDRNGFPQEIHQDVKDWFTTNLRGSMYRRSTYVDGLYVGETWVFSDANTAMLFKLTFL
jgi:hypothetical protein